MNRRTFVISGLSLALAGCSSFTGDRRHLVPLSGAAARRLAAIDSAAGKGMLVRIFKESSELELWRETTAGPYVLFDTYEICAWSGVLGPKIREGDRQAPEGFYSVSPGMMNPKSALYLSFNTGFPNKFDRAHGRTGTNLMVHGDCSSAGCYAMTDEQIKEIYASARESFGGGNGAFQLQMYPFRMTAENLTRFEDDPNYDFWSNLKEGYDVFEETKLPVVWDVCDKVYVFAPEKAAGSAAGTIAVCSEGDTAAHPKEELA